MNQTRQIQVAAESYYDNQQIENEKAAAIAEQGAEAIREAFEDCGPVPYVTTKHGIAKLRYLPFAEAVMDVIDYDEVLDALVEALKTSECPKVKALKAAMVDRHIYMNADEVGELL